MVRNSFLLIFTIALFGLSACNSTQKKKDKGNPELQQEVQTWLDSYSKEFQRLYAASSEGQWKLNTYIVSGDTVTSKEAEKAEKAFYNFAGSKAVVEKVKGYLARHEELTPLQVKQLEVILFSAAYSPEAAGALVDQRIQVQNRQIAAMYDFKFQLNGKTVSTNDIDRVLRESNDLTERLNTWNASKEVGTVLKNRLDTLRGLRNQLVQSLGYNDFFAYQASEYGWKSDELMNTCQKMVSDIWPLYRELHTWARYELAAKYNTDVPEYLPAHWLPNRWGQEWGELVQVEGINLDSTLKLKSAEWIVKEGEKFYQSLGFPALPKTFYEKSSLYPLEKNAAYAKNTHASAWHMDLDQDVRSLMSVEPNTNWWETTLHELGHIYYYMTYTNPDVPVVLRGGANRAYHEAMGSLIGLASLQKPFLENYGLIPAGSQSNQNQALLKEALNYVVLIPWSAGVMTEFEYELYSKNLPLNQYNAKWWELVKKYQGIVPPAERGEMYCDAATKTHINDDPAQYYDYAMSNILLFQFHVHIAKNILKQDPHATNYYGSKETGDFLRTLMYPGASVNWQEHLQKNLGSDMSAKPMLEYFEPLLVWLKEKNAGRTYTLPEKFE